MMTGSSYEPSQNVILSEARRRRAKSKDLWAGGIPNSDCQLLAHSSARAGSSAINSRTSSVGMRPRAV